MGRSGGVDDTVLLYLAIAGEPSGFLPFSLVTLGEVGVDTICLDSAGGTTCLATLGLLLGTPFVGVTGFAYDFPPL